MNFISTRGHAQKVTAAQAIARGLAPDGGLFVPETIPQLSGEDLAALCKLSYPERAAKILSLYLSDYTEEELLEDCRAVYAETSFVGGAAPLVALDDTLNVLELWHGPTAAFKDMALQIMPRLLSRALKKIGEKRTALILVATSGDTGKAALEGYRDLDQIKIIAFYPVDGVSKVQKLQMATQLGKNVSVCAIRGNFDDAQTGVKKIFGNAEISAKLNEKGYFLSSANSINWGRLAPQIVYYISAYCDLINAGKRKPGEPFNVCVPTGNFGNIFAAYLAKRMGLPINKLICASNSNNILTDFLTTGVYDRNRSFYLTMSPSMDILISSNLERLLWATTGTEKTAAYMKQLTETGKYAIDADTLATIQTDFAGYFANEDETANTIFKFWKEDRYLADPHTAVALYAAQSYLKQIGDRIPMVVDSTASPYKFANNVFRSIAKKEPSGDLEALDELTALTGVAIPYPLAGLKDRTVRFQEVCAPDEMPDRVLQFAD